MTSASTSDQNPLFETIRSILRKIPGLKTGVRSLRKFYGPWLTSKQVARYLKRNGVKGLHVGCGGLLIDGWLNTDKGYYKNCVYLDITKPFPIPSEAFDCIFGEHVIEHFSHATGIAILKECHRVLRPGAMIRMVTPSLENLVNLLGKALNLEQRNYLSHMLRCWCPDATATEEKAFLINQVFRGFGHQFIYDRPSLQASFERAGFSKIAFPPIGTSRSPYLRSIEFRSKLPMSAANAYESTVIEAVKRSRGEA